MAIDYAALAAKYGGTTDQELRESMAGSGDAPATDAQFMGKLVDYAALAAKHGGTDVNPDDAKHGVDDKDFEDKRKKILKGMTGSPVAEAGLATITGIGGAMLGGAAQAATSLYDYAKEKLTGEKRTPGVAQDVGSKVAEAVAYQPDSETGKKLAGYIGEAGSLFGALPAAAEKLRQKERDATGGNTTWTDAILGAATAAPTLMAKGVGKVADAVKNVVPEAMYKTPLDVSNEGSATPAMAGIGAAEATKAAQREARAAGLPVPIQLTKGQKTRDFEQTQFERETAKQTEGEPLRQRLAKQHEDLLRNFGVLEEQTGAEAGDLRETGTTVDRVMVNEKKKAKEIVKKEYDEAKAAGAMAEKVPYKAVQAYLDTIPPTVKAKLAPITEAVESELKRNDPEGTGMIPINNLEDIKQMINKNVTRGTPDQVHGIEINKLIKDATEDAGGDLYKKARASYYDYKQKFDNQGVIRKLLATKPNSTDRYVALEDVLNHTVLTSKYDELAAVKKLLGEGGAEGSQAWKELQGASLRHIQDEIAKGNAVDINGTKIPSPAALNTLITKLDKGGKLDLLFDKKTAQTLRDIRDTAVDALTAPPGSVNFSNTSSALVRALDKLEKVGSHIPVVSGVTKYIAEKAKSSALKKKVAEALEEPKAVPAEAAPRFTMEGKPILEKVEGGLKEETPSAPKEKPAALNSKDDSYTNPSKEWGGTVERHLKSKVIGKKWNVEASAHPTFDALPPEVKAKLIADYGEEEARKTRGAVVNGKVYVIANKHLDIPDVEATIAHEIAGHIGIHRLFGENYVKGLGELYKDIGGLEGLRKLAKERGITDDLRGYAERLGKSKFDDETRMAIMADEVLAHYTEKPKFADKVKAIVGSIRAALRKTGLFELAKKGDTDLLHTLAQGRKKLKGKATENEAPPVLSTKTKGKVFYHRTPKKFDEFQAESKEMGTHFGTEGQAKERRLTAQNEITEEGILIPAYLNIKKPYRMTDTGDFKPRTVLEQMAEDGVPGAKKLWVDFNDEMIKSKYRITNPSEESVKKLLKEQGYDGIVYLNRHENRGSASELGEIDYEEMQEYLKSDKDFKEYYPNAEDSYIAFSPSQIKRLDKLEQVGSHIPVVSGVTKYMAGKAKSSALKKKVAEALEEPSSPIPMAQNVLREVPPVPMSEAAESVTKEIPIGSLRQVSDYGYVLKTKDLGDVKIEIIESGGIPRVIAKDKNGEIVGILNPKPTEGYDFKEDIPSIASSMHVSSKAQRNRINTMMNRIAKRHFPGFTAQEIKGHSVYTGEGKLWADSEAAKEIESEKLVKPWTSKKKANE